MITVSQRQRSRRVTWSQFVINCGHFSLDKHTKSDTTQVNEVLCKALAHNLCVLTASIYELGIVPTFWSDAVAV